MTVKQLIAALQQMDPSAEVVMTADYGDRCHTMQALEIEEVEEASISKSAYSESGWRLDDEGTGEESREVVALR